MIFICGEGELKTTIYALVFLCLCGGCTCLCVLDPCQVKMHYLRCCCDTCACLKVSASF